MLLDESRIHPALFKGGAAYYLIIKVYVGLYALDDGLSQGGAHLSYCLVPVLTIYDELCYHGIIVGRELIALVGMGIQPDSVASGEMYVFHGAGAGHEAPFGRFRIDTAFYCMALDLYILLGEGELLPCGYPDLLLYDVHSAHQLCHGMLYLYSGVHLHEIESAGLVKQELYGSCILVAHCLCRLDCGPSEL